MEITEILEKQRDYFHSGATLPIAFRLEMLRRLYHAAEQWEEQIQAALQADLGKSAYESYLCEIGMVYTELRYLLRHTKHFAAKRRLPTSIAQFPSKGYEMACPYGNTLILSPWNYPFLLSIEPLADAIAAGNTVVLKPSAYAPNTAEAIQDMLHSCFPPEYVAVVTGGRAENQALLEQKFDMIFFTGSQAVGKEVLRHAAETLTPAVLELGGKSPCIVDETANIPQAARRIVFGKFLNCGQTCVAPDYILCHHSVHDRLVRALRCQIAKQYGAEPLQNPDYGHIINCRHYERLCGLLEHSYIIHGGQCNAKRLQIAPTLVDHVRDDDPIMQEEIFGPILPILTYDRLESVIATLHHKPKPLALYLFSRNRRAIDMVTRRCRYGGGCINDTIMHLTASTMGFGGVGESGMGAYHGKTGFDAFSHTKRILEKYAFPDLPMRYQPYKAGVFGAAVRKLMK